MINKQALWDACAGDEIVMGSGTAGPECQSAIFSFLTPQLHGDKTATQSAKETGNVASEKGEAAGNTVSEKATEAKNTASEQFHAAQNKVDEVINK